MLDVNFVYQRLAGSMQQGVQPTKDEETLLLLAGEVQKLQAAVMYLAGCNAASLESIPKSASKSSKERLKAICVTSIEMLTGKWSHPQRHVTYAAHVADRCQQALTL